jgi:hypothetical protein
LKIGHFPGETKDWDENEDAEKSDSRSTGCGKKIVHYITLGENASATGRV